MTHAAKLSDLQLILLATALKRDNGSLLPSPQHLGDEGARIRKAIPPLLKRKLVEEIAVSEPSQVWREHDGSRIGIAITPAARSLIAAEEVDPLSKVVASADPATNAKPSKIGVVLTLLQREQGASLPDMVEATGWLPHTMRAALTGLRKKGHAISRFREGDVSFYRIAEAG